MVMTTRATCALVRTTRSLNIVPAQIFALYPPDFRAKVETALSMQFSRRDFRDVVT